MGKFGKLPGLEPGDPPFKSEHPDIWRNGMEVLEELVTDEHGDIYSGPYLYLGQWAIDRNESPYEFLHEKALQLLLVEDLLDVFEETDGALKISVNCNDMFAWALADSQPLTYDGLEQLWKMFKAEGHWGVAKWCCIQRQSKPQLPVLNDMKKDGCWDETMEALPENIYNS